MLLAAFGGSMEETGSHKGYGLSTIVEILSSALQSAHSSRLYP